MNNVKTKHSSNQVSEKKEEISWKYLKALSLVIPCLMLVNVSAHAEQTAREKAKNDAIDAKKDSRKKTRKFKKKVRDAMGNGSIKKDAEDKVEDIKDDVNAQKDKHRNN